MLISNVNLSDKSASSTFKHAVCSYKSCLHDVIMEKSCLVKWNSISFTLHRWPYQSMPSSTWKVVPHTWATRLIQTVGVGIGEVHIWGSMIDCYCRIQLKSYGLKTESNATSLVTSSFPVSVCSVANGVLYQDIDPCHKTRIGIQWFQKHAHEFQLLFWSPYSPDVILFNTFSI